MEHVEPLLSMIINNVEPDLPHAAQKAMDEVNTLLKKKWWKLMTLQRCQNFLIFLDENNAIYRLRKNRLYPLKDIICHSSNL